MIQAKIEEANRCRGIAAAEREAHALDRAWFRERLVQEVVNILADAVVNQLENLEPDREGLVPPDEMGDRNAQQLHDHIENLLGILGINLMSYGMITITQEESMINSSKTLRIMLTF